MLFPCPLFLFGITSVKATVALGLYQNFPIQFICQGSFAHTPAPVAT